MRRGRAPLPGLLLAVALPLGIVATSAAAALSVHVTFPMSDSSIGDRASAACGFRVCATDSGQGQLEVFFDANGTAVRMQVHENTEPRRLRERCLPCADHEALPSASAMPAWQTFAAATRFRRRRALTAVIPKPRRSSHVRSAGQRPYAQEKEGAVHSRCRRLGGGSAGCLPRPGRHRIRAAGQRSVARCAQADSGPGERPAGCDDLAREGRPDGPATCRRLDRSVQRMRRARAGPS